MCSMFLLTQKPSLCVQKSNLNTLKLFHTTTDTTQAPVQSCFCHLLLNLSLDITLFISAVQYLCIAHCKQNFSVMYSSENDKENWFRKYTVMTRAFTLFLSIVFFFISKTLFQIIVIIIIIAKSLQVVCSLPKITSNFRPRVAYFQRRFGPMCPSLV